MPTLISRRPTVLNPARRFLSVLAVVSIPIVAIFWAQQLGSWWFTMALEPGNWGRAWAMLTSIWLHGSIDHAVSNIFALTVLVSLASYTYPAAIRFVIPGSVVGAGLAILFLGDTGSSGHIGASGIAYGLMAMFVAQAMLRRTRMASALFMVVVFLFGAAWWGLLPLAPHVSWEGHLGGAIGGFLSTIVARRKDPISKEERGIILEDADDDPTAPSSPPTPVHSGSKVV